MASGEVIKGSSARLKKIRSLLKQSQSQFATSLGVIPNTLARWERGDVAPSKLAELAAEYLLLIYKQQQKQPKQQPKQTTKKGGRLERKR
jgi:DNA-binding transcriptional regulator YiaG